LNRMPNSLAAMLPEQQKYEDVVKVYNLDLEPFQLMCEVVSQKVVCFLGSSTESAGGIG